MARDEQATYVQIVSNVDWFVRLGAFFLYIFNGFSGGHVHLGYQELQALIREDWGKSLAMTFPNIVCTTEKKKKKRPKETDRVGAFKHEVNRNDGAGATNAVLYP